MIWANVIAQNSSDERNLFNLTEFLCTGVFEFSTPFEKKLKRNSAIEAVGGDYMTDGTHVGWERMGFRGVRISAPGWGPAEISLRLDTPYSKMAKILLSFYIYVN